MFDLDRFIADCRAALASAHSASAVRELTARAVAVPREVEAALGSPRLGGLFTLHHAPDLTVLNVVWAPGMTIYPHEHRMWAVIGLYGGREDNTFYRCGERGLAIVGGKPLECSQTALQRMDPRHPRRAPVRRRARSARIRFGQRAR